MKSIQFIALASIALVLGCNKPHVENSHEEHEPDPVSVTIFTEKTLLFIEYPHLVAGKSARFLAHFSVLATGEPVREGKFRLEANGPGGKTESIQMDAPTRAGIFIPEHTFSTAGGYSARITLDSPQASDTLELSLTVHQTEEAAIAAAGESGDDRTGSVPFLLEQQWKIGTLLVRVQSRSLVERLRVSGEIAPKQGYQVVVSSPVTGCLYPPARAKLPNIGDFVKEGDIIAEVEPPLPVPESLAMRANKSSIESVGIDLTLRSLDLEIEGLRVEQECKKAEVRLAYAKRAFSRASKIMEKGVASEQQLEQVQEELELAQMEFDSTLALKKSYLDSVKKLAEIRDQTAKGTALMDGAVSLRIPLRAPISGRIISCKHVEGEQVKSLDTIYEILDVEKVWVEASLSEFDIGKLPERPNATLVLPSSPKIGYDVMEMGGRLVNIGDRVDSRTRTVPVVFEVPNEKRVFKAGMFVDVFLETQAVQQALSVPEEAIVMDSGIPLVFVMLEGELFQRREVRIGIRDKGWAEVIDGVKEGERVATRGAYAIKLAALTPASFGHGHGH